MYPVFAVYLDGLKPKDKVFAAVYEDVCQEICRLQGKDASQFRKKKVCLFGTVAVYVDIIDYREYGIVDF